MLTHQNERILEKEKGSFVTYQILGSALNNIIMDIRRKSLESLSYKQQRTRSSFLLECIRATSEIENIAPLPYLPLLCNYYRKKWMTERLN